MEELHGGARHQGVDQEAGQKEHPVQNESVPGMPRDECLMSSNVSPKWDWQKIQLAPVHEVAKQVTLPCR